MSQAGGALLGLAALIGITQWLWGRLVAHLDPQLIPAVARRRVDRIRAKSAHVYLASGGVAACVLCTEAVLLLG